MLAWRPTRTACATLRPPEGHRLAPAQRGLGFDLVGEFVCWACTAAQEPDEHGVTPAREVPGGRGHPRLRASSPWWGCPSRSLTAPTPPDRPFEQEHETGGAWPKSVPCRSTSTPTSRLHREDAAGRRGDRQGLRALAPIGAVAVPAVAGLASELGFAAVGAGTAVLAFHGLGDALTKFNKAALEPTATNIANAQVAMEKIPPSAQAFVLQLHQLNPELDRLRRSAASGLFEGLSTGLRSASADLPLVRRLVGDVSTELGVLGREGGRSLSSNQWKPFLRFVDAEAPQALDHMGHAVGAATHGLAELWMAFAPVSRDMDQGILHLAQDFDRWATSLGRTKDFQSFLAYVDLNGPKVIQLLGQTGQLFVDIVQAAAPLGGPTLDALNLIVKALDLIASSPIATPLLALAQVNSVLKLTSRGMQGLGVDAAIGLGGVTKGSRTATAELTGLRAQAASAGAALRTIGGNVRRYTTSGTTLLAGVKSEDLANLGKAAALAGGLAIASSGASDAMGLQNTAMLATAGLVAGPWGAAVGGAVGIGLDWKASLDRDAQSVKDLHDQVSQLATAGDILALSKLADQGQRISDFAASKGGVFSGLQSQALIPTEAFDTLSGSILKFNTELTGTKSPIFSMGDMQQAALRMQPAMAKLGLTFDDMLNMDPTELAATVDHLSRMTARADAAQGSAHSVAKALADMGDQALTTDQRIQTLSDSLDALLGPGLNLSAATDAWHQGLNTLNKDLHGTRVGINDFSTAAINNKEVIRQNVENLSAMIKAQAAAGASPEKLTRTLRDQRQALIDAGAAAGVSRTAMRSLLDTYGLTPKLVRTAVQLSGVADAIRTLDALTRTRIAQVDVHVNRIDGGIQQDTNVTGGHIARAGGGTVPGPRHPYRDKVLIHAAPGEEIITNRHGEADRFRADRALGRIPAYAGGGTVSTSTSRVQVGPYAGSGLGAAADDAVRGLRGLKASLADSTKELDQERQHRQQLAQARQQVISTARDSFRSEFLGTTSDSVWGAGGSDPAGILRDDIRNARRFRRDIGRLRRRGISAGLASQVTTLAGADQLAAMSPAELRQLNRLYAIRQRASQAAGVVVGNAAYGAKLDESNQHLRQLRGDVHRLTDQVKHLEAEQKKNAKATGDALGNKINGAAGTASRRSR
jgi:hypothetical protein